MLDRLNAALAPFAAWLGRLFAQPDKVLHLIGGAIIAAAVLGLCLGPLAVASAMAVIVALWIVAVVAWLKERYDKSQPPARHTWDGWDAFATLLGALVCVTLYVTAWAEIADQWGIG